MALNRVIGKKKLIELQNFIFKTNEKKLQVSLDFLDRMVSNYVYKKIRIVNQNVERIFKTTSPSAFFQSYNLACEYLSELVKMQEYFIFKYPTPEEYRKVLISRKSEFIDILIVRSWRKLQNNNTIEKSTFESDEERNRHFFNGFMIYANEMSKSNIKKLNELHKLKFKTEIAGSASDVTTENQDATQNNTEENVQNNKTSSDTHAENNETGSNT